MVKTRLLSALALIGVIWVLLYWLPPLATVTAALALLAIAAREWGRLIGREASFNRDYALWICLSAAVLLWLIHQPWGNVLRLAVLGAAVLFWSVLAPWWLARGEVVAGSSRAPALGAMLLLATWVAFVDLLAHGPTVLLLTMAVVWVSDSFAYFSGRSLGRRKLAPRISPNKTWEGAAGALVGVMLYAFAVNAWSAFSLSLPLVLGMTILGILGDLFESSVKRQAGVKDSGNLLPGHGGALDRIDALMAALPLAALWLALTTSPL